MKIGFPNLKKWKIGNLICIILILANSGYALTVGYTRFNAICSLILMIGLCFGYIKHIPKYVDLLGNEILLAFMMLCIFLAALLNLDIDSALEYFRNISIILSGYFISKLITPKEFIYYFTRSMRLIVFISLIMFMLIQYGGVLIPVVVNGAGTNYVSIFIFSMDITNLTTGIWRNSGVFWEPGLFAGFITFALIAELFFVQEHKYKFFIILIYFLALITTMSTAAFVYVFLGIAMLFSSYSKNFGQITLVIILLIISLVMFINYENIVLYLYNWKPSMFEKIITQNISYSDRLYYPLADFAVSLQYPFGCGAGNLTNLVKDAALKWGIILYSRTSTLTYFFAAFGMLCGCVFNYYWIRGITRLNNLRFLDKLLIIVTIVIVTSASPMAFNTFLWIAVFILADTKKVSKYLSTGYLSEGAIKKNEGSMGN